MDVPYQSDRPTVNTSPPSPALGESLDEMDGGSSDVPISGGERLVAERFPDHPGTDAVLSEPSAERVSGLVGESSDPGGLAEPTPEAIEAVTREWGVVPVVASLQRQEQAATRGLLRSDLGQVLGQLGAKGITEGDAALLASLALADADDPQPAGGEEVVDGEGDQLSPTQPGLDGEQHQEPVTGRSAGGEQAALVFGAEHLGGVLGLADSSDGERSRVDQPSPAVAEAEEDSPGSAPVIDARRLHPRTQEFSLETLELLGGDVERPLYALPAPEGDSSLASQEPAVGLEGGGSQTIPSTLAEKGVHSHIPRDLRTRHRGPQRYSNEDVITGPFNCPPEHADATLQHEQGERGAPRRIRTPDLLIRRQTDSAKRVSKRGRVPLNRGPFDWGLGKTADECWIPDLVPGATGYVYIKADGRSIGAHRWVWEQIHGPIPTGLQIDHSCHNIDLTCPGGERCHHRACLNPNHLTLASQLVNLRNSPLTSAGKHRLSQQAGI
jgi:hypothetical protein